MAKSITSTSIYSGKIYNITRTILTLTSPGVGQVIGSDGKNYNYASLPSGVTAVAMICYVSGSHGLALALADEAGERQWDYAHAASAHEPKFFDTTSLNAIWKLATKDEWDNMITAAGTYQNLRDGFTSVGGTNLQPDNYWSSTEVNTSTTDAWRFHFSDGSSGWNWNQAGKDQNARVRAALAF